jgi:GT2 family glycosyltransferase
MATNSLADLTTAGTPDGVPAVVAVVVACNPGHWFEETLEALRDQDYPNVALLVIDAASTEDPLDRVADVAPSAYVRRLARNPGFAAAANRSMRIVHGASYLLICHDDVAPAPDAVRRMVECAFRTNAGVVTPKMVDWHDPNVLLEMGGTIDSSGAYVPNLERGDLDQGQHDHSDEVFVAPGGCMLIRADLFSALGGFDASMRLYGEDVDLSWRAQVAGARIVTEPAARVRHLAAAEKGMRINAGPTVDDDGTVYTALDELALRRRHRLRTALKVPRGLSFIAMVVRLALLSIAEIAFGIVTGRGNHVSAVVAAWTWNLAHWRDLLKLRRHVRKHRVVSDKELRIWVGSSRSRLEEVLRREAAARQALLDFESRGRELVGIFRNLPRSIYLVLAVVWLLGSRQLLSNGIPEFGRFVDLGESPAQALRQFSGMLPSEAWGIVTTQSPAHLVAGVLGVLFLGNMDALHDVLILGMLPLGVYGISRLTKPLQSPRARLMAIVAYAALPLPYDSLREGRWDGLVVYALAPFVLSRLARVLGALPYAPWSVPALAQPRFRRRASDDEQLEEIDLAAGTAGERAHAQAERLRQATAILGNEDAAKVLTAQPRNLGNRARVLFLRNVTPLGLLLALGAIVAPQMLFGAIVTACAFAIGALITKEGRPAALRTIFTAVFAAGLAFLLVAPGIIGSDAAWRSMWQTPMASSPDALSDLLRFVTDDSRAAIAPSVLTFGLLLAGLPGLLIGDGWRFKLSVRMWCIFIATVGLTWAGARGWLGPIVPSPYVFGGFAGVALALNAAAGAVAVQEDLRAFRFGWRQVLPFAAVLGVVLAVVPVMTRAGNGSWGIPTSSVTDRLSWMSDRAADSSFRVVWLGDANSMPGGPRRLDDDLAAAVSVDGPNVYGPALPSAGGDGQKKLGDAIEQARGGLTVELGKLVAPLSVRYLVVPNDSAANERSGNQQDLITALSDQLDLRQIAGEGSLMVFENLEFLPLRSQLSPEATLAAHAKDGDVAVDLGTSRSVLPKTGSGTWSGAVEGGDVFVAQQSNSGWELTVGGRPVARDDAFGWANSFAVQNAGNATLRYKPSVVLVVLQVLNAAFWTVTLIIALRYRIRLGRWA